MTSSSGPFWIGTALYIVVGIFACLFSVCLGQLGKNRHVGLSLVLLPIAVFCMWVLWAMAWLMQWHPIIKPEREEETD